MSRKNVYKLPVVDNLFVLESKYESPEDEERKKAELIENMKKEAYQQGWNEALEKNKEDVELISQSLNKAIEDFKTGEGYYLGQM